MTTDEAAQAIGLFNEKAEELLTSHFARYIKNAHGRVGLTYRWERGVDGIAVERRYPDRDDIKAVVLTLRFFIQDKDGFSIRNLGHIYDTLGIDEADKEEFGSTQTSLTSYLDSHYPEVWEGRAYTRREVMNIFIYGNLAHANQDKKTVHDSWRQLGDFFSDNELAFVATLAQFIKVIAHIKNINKRVLKQLQR